MHKNRLPFYRSLQSLNKLTTAKVGYIAVLMAVDHLQDTKVLMSIAPVKLGVGVLEEGQLSTDYSIDSLNNKILDTSPASPHDRATLQTLEKPTMCQANRKGHTLPSTPSRKLDPVISPANKIAQQNAFALFSTPP